MGSSSRNLPPTAKKLKKARQEGDVAKSKDLTAALVILCAGPVCLRQLRIAGDLSRDYWEKMSLGAGDLHNSNVLICAQGAIREVILLLCPIFLAVVLSALAAETVQIGFQFTFKLLAFKASRLSLVQGFRRILGFREGSQEGAPLGLLAEAGRIGCNFIIVSLSVCWVYARLPLVIFGADFGEAAEVVNIAYLAVLYALGPAMVMYLIMGLSGLIWARRQRIKRLQMNVEELRQDIREAEGDPEAKNMRSYLHKELAGQAMIQAVRKARVLVVGD